MRGGRFHAVPFPQELAMRPYLDKLDPVKPEFHFDLRKSVVRKVVTV
jgi:hypothetical protein